MMSFGRCSMPRNLCLIIEEKDVKLHGESEWSRSAAFRLQNRRDYLRHSNLCEGGKVRAFLQPNGRAPGPLEVLSSCIIGYLLFTVSAFAEDKVTYQDNILPLIEANCSKCHNADKKKADLELTSYQGALKGSGSGPVLVSGNLDGSKLWKALNHTEEPFMPPNRPKLDDKDLEKFKKWTAGGLWETAKGKAVR